MIINPYVFASAGGGGGLPTGGSWAQVGNGLDLSATITYVRDGLVKIAADRVALIYDGATVQAYDWDGTDYTIVGNALTFSENVTNDSACKMADNQIAVVGSTTKELYVYDFDGTNWSKTGTTLDVSGVGNNPFITRLSNTRVVVVGQDSLQAYDWSGSSWSTEGNSFTLPNTGGSHYIQATSSTRIIDHTSESIDEIRCYDFDGTDWSETGNRYDYTTTTGGPGRGMATLNDEDIVVLQDFDDSKKAKAVTFDGTDFSFIGSALNSDTSNTKIFTHLDAWDISYYSVTDDELQTWRFTPTY
jgi:hypothetical protein